MPGSTTVTSFGRVISVRESLARVGLLAASQLGLSAVRATVGRFVSIRCSNSTIVAMITEVSCEGLPSSDAYIATAGGRSARRNPRRPGRAPIPARRHRLSGDRRAGEPDHQQELRTDLRAVRIGHDQHRHTCSRIRPSAPMSTSTKCSASISRCSAPPASASRAASSLILQRDPEVAARTCASSCSTRTTNTAAASATARWCSIRATSSCRSGCSISRRSSTSSSAAAPASTEEVEILAEVIPLAKGSYTQYHGTADRLGAEAHRSEERPATPSTRRCPTGWPISSR